MDVLNLSQNVDDHFADELFQLNGVNVRDCYQCGKCSAGCPIAFTMDYRPQRLIRLVQLGMRDEALDSKSIWVCATCSTCTARCPRGFNPAGVMEGLRIMAFKEGRYKKAKSAYVFHDTFMKSIKSFGRTYELGLMVETTLRNLNFFDNADVALPTLLKGKLKFLPPRVKGGDEVKKIIDACDRLEGEKS